MSSSKDIKNGQEMKRILIYLGNKFGEKVATKIAQKLTKKLGLKMATKLIGGSIPGKLIADAATSGMRWMYFEGSLNNRQETPYHPEKYPDQYVEFLVYSWARTGKPCYIPDPIIYAAPGSLAN